MSQTGSRPSALHPDPADPPGGGEWGGGPAVHVAGVGVLRHVSGRGARRPPLLLAHS
jgi:hypothetical protein